MAEPKLRFRQDDGSSYPEWREYSISDLFTKIGTKNKNCENTNVITNSAEFGLIPQRDYFDKDIAVEGKTDNYTIIQTGDFVYNPRKSLYAPMGPFNCYRLEEEGIVSPLYSCLRPKGLLNPEYLLWYFQTDKWYEYVNDHGAQNGARHDRVGMTDKILMGIPITAPCDEEQQKIADFLSAVDEVIAASEAEAANLESQKKAVMKKIFSQEVRFKKENGSDFPEWNTTTLGNLVGKVSSGKDKIEEGDVPLYGSMGPIGTCLSASYKGNKILVARVGANAGSVRLVAEDCGVTDNTLIIQDIQQCDFTWLYYTLLEKDIGKMKFGGGQPLVTGKMLFELEMELPCLEEQHLIANFLSDFDEAIASAKKELELWKKLKKGLLQQMFV